MVDYVLVHYGVKGMKWGVRKEEKLAKRERSQIDAEARLIRRGKSPEEARRIVTRNKKIAKAVFIAAGATLAVATAYTIRDTNIKQRSEVILEKGAKLSHIRPDLPDFDLDKRLYTTFLDADSDKYDGMFVKHLSEARKTLQTMGRPVANQTAKYTLVAKEQIRAPSQDQAEKLFKTWAQVNNNPKYGALSGTALRRAYQTFNQDAVYGGEDHEKFYGFLKTQGYNAILDANDQFLSGFDAKKPLILFNAASSAVVSGKKVVDESEAIRKANKQTAKLLGKTLAPTIAQYGLLAGAAKAVVTKTKNSVANDEVDAYLKDHPESKKSRAEVAAMLLEEGKL